MATPAIREQPAESCDALHYAPATANDAFLIAEVLRGRSDLFANLLEPHLPAPFRLVRAKLRNDTDAEDVVQQTVLKAFTKLEQFRHEATFRTWLSQIAINEVRQLQRKCLSGATIPLEQNSLGQFADPAASPFEECERHERIDFLHRALPKLQEDYRVLIHLRDLQQHSIVETAGLLQLNVSTVKTRHRRARLTMARLLACIRPAAIHRRPASPS